MNRRSSRITIRRAIRARCSFSSGFRSLAAAPWLAEVRRVLAVPIGNVRMQVCEPCAGVADPPFLGSAIRRCVFRRQADVISAPRRHTCGVTGRQQVTDGGIVAAIALGCTLEVWAPQTFGSTHMTGPRLAVYVARRPCSLRQQARKSRRAHRPIDSLGPARRSSRAVDAPSRVRPSRIFLLPCHSAGAVLEARLASSILAN